LALKFINQIIKIKAFFLIISYYAINYAKKSFIIFKSLILCTKNYKYGNKKEVKEYNIYLIKDLKV
jgi:hypothetical protein